MSVGVWLLASRPKTLAAGIAPVIIGTVLAWRDGQAHWGAAAVCLLAAMSVQIDTNFANDYYDFIKGADTAERIGPTRAVQAGLVTPAQMRVAFLLAFGLFLLISAGFAWWRGWPLLVLGVLAAASGVLYTGGPRPLGYLGLGDIFAFVFFGPVCVAATAFVQRGQLLPLDIVAGIQPGLLSVALLTVNNLRDVSGDAKAGKRTLAVRFGVTFARWEYTLAIVGAALLPGLISLWQGRWPWLWLSLALLLPAVPGLRTVWTQRDGPALNACLGRTGKLLFVATLLFVLGVCL